MAMRYYARHGSRWECIILKDDNGKVKHKYYLDKDGKLVESLRQTRNSRRDMRFVINNFEVEHNIHVPNFNTETNFSSDHVFLPPISSLDYKTPTYLKEDVPQTIPTKSQPSSVITGDYLYSFTLSSIT